MRFFATQKRALFASLSLLFGLAACQVLLDDDTTSCSTDSECTTRFGAGAVCSEGLCRSDPSKDPTKGDGSVNEGGDAPDSATPPECTTNAECVAKFTAEGQLDAGVDDAGNPVVLDGGFTTDGKIAAVCVKQTHKCARLVTPECRDYIGDPSNDNAIILGTFLSVSGSLAASNIPRQRSALLAAKEFNSSTAGGGIPGPDGTPVRPLVVVNCDPSTNNDTGSPMRAAKHLIEELRVPAFVGPNVAQEFVDINNEYAAKERPEATVMISPTVPIIAATGFNDRNLTWRTIPSDAQRTKLLIEQVGEVENKLKTERGRPIRLGILYRDEALGQSALDSVSATLTINGKSLSATENSAYVSIKKYANQNDTAGMNAVATEWRSFKPDIVLVSTQEIVNNFVAPLEKGLATDGVTELPYYIGNDIAKTPNWWGLYTTQGVDASVRLRVRGIGTTPDGASGPLFAAFNLAYGNEYGGQAPTTAGMGPAYDAMYAIGYALAATRAEFPPTGLTVAKGLQRLASGTTVNVGASNITAGYQTLNGPGGTVNLRGTFGLLSFTEKGDISGGTLEVWCIKGSNAFGSSGMTMDVGSQTIAGSFTQCGQ